MSKRIEWIGRPRVAATTDIFGWLGVPGFLGAPPGCPSGTTVTPDYATCREQTRQAAIGMCGDMAAAVAAGAQTWSSFGYANQGDCVEKRWNEGFFSSGCMNLCGPEVFPPCSSAQIVKSVQADLGRPQTGVWTKEDEEALPAGYTFASYAPDCTGPAPTPAGPGPLPQPPPPKPAPTASSGGGGWLLLAFATLGALWFAAS